MADFTEQQLLSQDPEVLGLQRQRQLANLLTGQAFNQPQGQMISGHYVAPSGLQQALPMINAAIGGLTNANLDTKQQELAQMLQQRKSAATQGILGAAMGQELPAQAGPMPNGGNIPIQRTPADIAKALRLASEDTTGAGKTFMPSLLEQAMPKQIPEQIKYKMAVDGGFKGTFNDFINQMSEVDKQRISLEKQRLGLEGAKFAFEKSQAEGGAKLTESQGNATGFGIRAKESNAILNTLEAKGTQHPGVVRQIATGAVKNIPIVGGSLENAIGSTLNVLPNVAGGTNADQQSFLAAKKNFITAVLRKESGASIAPSEFDTEEKKYFAQVGDDAATVRQKQHARETAIQSLKIQAGPGAKFINEFTPQTDFGATDGGWRLK